MRVTVTIIINVTMTVTMTVTSANVTVADAVIVTVTDTDTVTLISPRYYRDREPGHERNRDMTVTLKVTISRFFMSDSHGEYLSSIKYSIIKFKYFLSKDNRNFFAVSVTLTVKESPT